MTDHGWTVMRLSVRPGGKGWFGKENYMTSPRDSQNTQTKIAVISAGWHADIVDRAATSFIGHLPTVGLQDAQVERFAVPGAFEIPLLCQRLARQGGFDAIVACALVVDGGIYRHDFVASAVIDGLMRVQLDEGVPIFSAVLTPHHFHDHADHQDFFATHLDKKGREVADAVAAVLMPSRIASAA
ncbi:MAG: 6,7-dimethyl-8-ribityllumazine synthase [Alphaproteobacteria bacterium]|nr:6,7-dimethyl-8-ribityllumazine synthase [Alphaproteobacteria bacterium]